ncbi:MAG: copper-binding protein [Thermodesulfobacteriota bacterium]
MPARREAARLAAATLAALAVACTGLPEGKLYPIRGEVVAVGVARNEVTLRHEAVAGFMEAMTMPFPVAKRELLDGVEPGDRVEGVLLVEGARYVILSLAEIPPATEEPPQPTAPR